MRKAVHPLDAPFYSFQKRLGSGELRTPQLNDQNRRLFHLPSQAVERRWFVADVEEGTDSACPNPPQRIDVPPSDPLVILWQRHRKG